MRTSRDDHETIIDMEDFAKIRFRDPADRDADKDFAVQEEGNADMSNDGPERLSDNYITGHFIRTPGGRIQLKISTPDEMAMLDLSVGSKWDNIAGQERVELIRPRDFDYEPEEDEDKYASFGHGEGAGFFNAPPPEECDHRETQTVVKHQGDRGTCVAFASIAAMEAAMLKTFPQVGREAKQYDLSEQYVHYNFVEERKWPHNQRRGIRTTDATKTLSKDGGDGAPQEHQWPYVRTQREVNNMVSAREYSPSHECSDSPKVYFRTTKIVRDNGLTGESIKNVEYLEHVLSCGYDIVIGTWVGWKDEDNDGILDPMLDKDGHPLYYGGHAMLLVGYNRKRQYFILKNSWGNQWGHEGYAYLSYKYVEMYFKYGFIVYDVGETQVVHEFGPQVFDRVTYHNSIRRADLTCAIVFFKTYKGGRASALVMSGNNLMMHGIRAYSKGSHIPIICSKLSFVPGAGIDLDSLCSSLTIKSLQWTGQQIHASGGTYVSLAMNVHGITSEQIKGLTYDKPVVPHTDVPTIIVGTTTMGSPFKLVITECDGDRATIPYLEVMDEMHTVVYNLVLESARHNPKLAYNIDKGEYGGPYSDIGWDGHALVAFNSATIRDMPIAL